MSKVHVKKGDKVVVLTGRDSGKTGTVLEVLPKKNRVVVDGVNIVKKHQKPLLPKKFRELQRSVFLKIQL